MLAFFLISSLISVCLIGLGWAWFKRRHVQTAWTLFLPVFGMGLWFAVTRLGLGRQSLGNMVELSYVAAAAVLLAYVKFTLLDRSQSEKRAVIVIYLVTVLVVFGLRMLMPVLPE